MIKNATIRSGSNRGLLMLGIFLALVTAALIAYFLAHQTKSGGGGTYSGTTTPVVVAAQDIPAYSRITGAMVTVKQIPTDAVLAGAFTNTKTVVGQVTNVPIIAGEQVVPSKVTATGTDLSAFSGNPPASVLVPQGKRGFSVAIFEESAAGGLVRAGDFVDLIASSAKPVAQNQSGQPGQPTPEAQSLVSSGSCYVAQDVEVLAIAQNLKPVGTQKDASGLASAANDPKALEATLAVTPEQAARLAAAQGGLNQSGQVASPLWVALRPFGERGDVANLPACNITLGS